MKVGDDKGLHCYRAAEEAVTRLGLSVRRGEPLQLDSVLIVIPDLVDHLRQSDDLIIRALSGAGGSPLITNLIHVGVLSIKLGMGLDYGRTELEQLALAGLLHDIGIFAIPEAMLLKRESLSEDERQMLEQHPELGADLIRALGTDYDWLAVVIQQAHERWSGQGYPHGIRGNDIHEYAQIIGVADAFDAMVNPRPHHTRLFPQDAVRVLLNESTPAFSRRLIKVLVKHLSAFPLGTTVRLNIGARAMVSKVNRKFPMRPVVELFDQTDKPSGKQAATIDLSKTPLVHIVETIEPPALDRTAINPSHSLEAHVGGLSSSEDVSPLLEHLDSIACLMEGAVQPSSALLSETNSADPMMPSQVGVSQDTGFADPEFQEEVLELFSLESQEWLLQIQSAFSELAANPPQELLPKIFDLLTRGLTNLGGSAAIVALPDIEQQAFRMIPVIQSFRVHEAPLTEEEISGLREQVTQLGNVVANVVGLPPSFDEEGEDDEEEYEESWDEEEPESSSLDNQNDEEESIHSHAPIPDQDESPLAAHEAFEELPDEAARTDQPAGEEDVAPPLSLYATLKELHEARKEILVSNRHVSDQILSKVEEECVPTPESLEPETLTRLLEEHEQRDAEFLADFEGRIPPIVAALDELKGSEQNFVITEESLSPILLGLQDLQAVARGVNAGNLDPFLTGLLTFLKVVAHRQVSSALPRLQAVEMRLQALRPMAQQWVEMGHVERTTIRQLLPEES